MIPWYEAAFGADYLERYAHRDAEEARRAVAQFLAATGLGPTARILDLCCGAGRHVLAFAEAGHEVVGYDLSRDLLRAASKALAAQPRALLVQGDKRRIALRDAAFDGVTHFFTAFGYFDRDEENLAVFHEVARVLRTGGWYLFDFLNAASVLREFERRDSIATTESPAQGVEVRSVRTLAPGRRRVQKAIEVLRDGQPRHAVTESVRLFTPVDLRAGLSRARLRVEQEWGGYAGEPFSAGESSRWIALSRRM